MSDEPQELPTDFDRRIGRRIAFYREEAGLTRAELAEQLGTTEDEVEAWETAKVVTYAGDIVALCRALDIEPDLLMSKLR
jgi:transcriptional regulator with XRE-family HTH domain